MFITSRRPRRAALVHMGVHGALRFQTWALRGADRYSFKETHTVSCLVFHTGLVVKTEWVQEMSGPTDDCLLSSASLDQLQDGPGDKILCICMGSPAVESSMKCGTNYLGIVGFPCRTTVFLYYVPNHPQATYVFYNNLLGLDGPALVRANFRLLRPPTVDRGPRVWPRLKCLADVNPTI